MERSSTGWIIDPGRRRQQKTCTAPAVPFRRFIWHNSPVLLLAVARLPCPAPASPDRASSTALVEAARVTGLSAADVRTRLAGPLPRVLHIEAVPARANTLAAALEELGFAVLVGDPRAAPGDDDRLQ